MSEQSRKHPFSKSIRGYGVGAGTLAIRDRAANMGETIAYNTITVENGTSAGSDGIIGIVHNGEFIRLYPFTDLAIDTPVMTGLEGLMVSDGDYLEARFTSTVAADEIYLTVTGQSFLANE